mgnify:CR=1 FL=1
MDKILIFGNGQLGNFYLQHFVSRNTPASMAKVDITDIAQVARAIRKFQPTVVINTAAKTNLEWCVQNKLAAFNVNVLGANNIAQICDQEGIYLIHLSSGCILASIDEEDAKKEDDPPHPTSYYSWTKVWAENLIGFKKSPGFKYLILRPRQPISSQINYKNMLLKLLTFTKFVDTPNSGTVLEDLMDWTTQLIKKRTNGTLHVSNSGWSTPYQIGLLLKKHIFPDLPVNKITKQELGKLTPEIRIDTVLDVTKLESLVGKVKPYRQRVEETIIRLGKNFTTADPSLIKEQMEKTVAQSKTRTVVNDVWKQLLH